MHQYMTLIQDQPSQIHKMLKAAKMESSDGSVIFAQGSTTLAEIIKKKRVGFNDVWACCYQYANLETAGDAPRGRHEKAAYASHMQQQAKQEQEHILAEARQREAHEQAEAARRAQWVAGGAEGEFKEKPFREEQYDAQKWKSDKKLPNDGRMNRAFIRKLTAEGADNTSYKVFDTPSGVSSKTGNLESRPNDWQTSRVAGDVVDVQRPKNSKYIIIKFKGLPVIISVPVEVVRAAYAKKSPQWARHDVSYWLRKLKGQKMVFARPDATMPPLNYMMLGKQKYFYIPEDNRYMTIE